MSTSMTIRRMHADEIQIAIDWAEQEGWNPGIHDAETFRLADPNGFFIGECNGKVIALGSAIVYDEQFAFCGLYIVHPDYRARGYGLQLTQERLRYVGQRNAGIDGVVENIAIYQRIGYRFAYHNIRYQGSAVLSDVNDQAIRPLSQIAFDKILRYDQECFPANRSAFLNAWINQADAQAFGFVEDRLLKGFGVRRQCKEGHKIGPLFADNLHIAEVLLQALLQDIAGETFFLDITEINPAAKQLVETHAMESVFMTGRMYLKGQPKLADDKVFGITTFELG